METNIWYVITDKKQQTVLAKILKSVGIFEFWNIKNIKNEFGCTFHLCIYIRE